MNVREGQTVAQSDEIGLMGNTGNSFGAHLHFEVRKYKAAPSGNLHDVNAYEWLDAGGWLDKEFPGAVTFVEVKAGAKFDLRDTPIYNSESGKSYGRRSGTYYVWSDEVINGRVRMTNSAARVGVNKQVSFWVALEDIGAATEVKAETPAEAIPVTENTLSEVKAGLKVELKDTPVYNTETGASVGLRSGTYYVWSEEVKNGRVRMTNSAARVGERGQVSFWANVAELTEP